MKQILRLAACFVVLVMGTDGASAAAGAQDATAKPAPALVPVSAPYAQKLLVNEMKSRDEIQKIGLHAAVPESGENVIIACNLPEKIGKRSSAPDMAVVSSGKPSVIHQEKGGFWDMALPISDVKGKDIGGGLLVLEIPFKYAASESDALRRAYAIRDEIQAHIANKEALFQ